MSIEDLTTYTEVDAGNNIVISTSKVTFTSLNRGSISYVYKDKGVDNFDSDFIHEFKFRYLGASSYAYGWTYPWFLSNVISHEYICLEALGLRFESKKFTLQQKINGSSYDSNQFTTEINVDYFLTIERDESVGTYGTLYCRIYSDEARTNLLHTLTLLLQQAKQDFRYFYALCNRGVYSGTWTYHSGSAEDLNLFEEDSVVNNILFFGSNF
jgi:hypothetical protein